jgi:hypothetical protein
MKDSIEMKVKRGEKSQSYFWSIFFFSTFVYTIVGLEIK